MAQPKAPGKSGRMIWRISDRAPLGEWVDPAPPPTPPKEALPEVSSGRWVRSSFDLLNGIEINDDPNTVPDDLFDELFAPPDEKTRPPRK
jgi:hypothetical protein